MVTFTSNQAPRLGPGSAGHLHGLQLRCAVPADAAALGALYARQSCAHRRQRFNAAVSLSASRLLQMASPDGVNDGAWVVHHPGTHELLADARWVRVSADSAELALLVDAVWHGQGLGCWALQALSQQAHAARVRHLHAHVCGDNEAMQKLLRQAGFDMATDGGDDEQQCKWIRDLRPGPKSARSQAGARWGLRGLLATGLALLPQAALAARAL